MQIKEKIPSLAELGGHQLYPADPSVGAFSPYNVSLRAASAYAFGTRPSASTYEHPALSAGHVL